MKKGQVMASYDGEWCKGLRDGSGTCVYADGSKYTGAKENKKVGNSQKKLNAYFSILVFKSLAKKYLFSNQAKYLKNQKYFEIYSVFCLDVIKSKIIRKENTNIVLHQFNFC